MTDPVIKVRIQLDASDVTKGIAAANEAVSKLGPGVSQSAGQASASLNQFSASNQQAAASAAFLQAQSMAATSAAQAAAQAASQVGTVTKASMDKAAASLNSVSSSIDSVRNMFLGLLGVGSFTALIREAEQYADAYTNITAKIILTTSTEEQRAQVLGSLLSISQQTGSSIESNTKLYQRMYQSLESAGEAQTTAQRRALELTDEITKILISSGATAQESKFAIQDLSHGLAEGTIQWRQLSQVMREAPQLAKALADGLGVTIGQLKGLASSGKITTEAFTDALLSQAGKVNATFAQVPLTFARAIQQMENSVTVFVGQASQASRASELLKQGIIGIGNNLGPISAGLEAIGAVIALNLGSRAIGYIGSLIDKIGAIIAPTQAAAVATLRAAEADQAAALAAVNHEKALIGQLEAMNAALAAEANLAKADYASAASVDVAVAARQRLNAALAAQVGVSDAAIAADLRLTVAERELALSTAQVGLAAEASVAELTIAEAAASGFAAVGSGLFAIIGGLPGLAIAAAAGFIYLATRTTEAQDAMEAMDKSAQALESRLPTLTLALLQLSRGQQVHKQTALEAAQAELEQAKAALAAEVALNGISMQANYLRDTVNKATAAVDGLKDAAARLANAKLKDALLGIVTGLAGEFEKLGNAQAHYDAQNRQITEGLSKEEDAMVKRAATLGMNSEEILKYTLKQQLLATGLKDGTDAFNKQYVALVALNQKGLDAAKTLDIYKDGQTHVKDNSKAITAALNEQYAAEEKLGELIDSITGKIDKTDQIQAQYNKELAEAQKLTIAYLAAGGSLAVAIDLLGRAEAAANAELAVSLEKQRELAVVAGENVTTIGALKEKWKEETTSLGENTQAHQLVVAELAAHKQAQEALNASIKAGDLQTDEEIANLFAVAKAHADADFAINQSKAVYQQYQQVYVSGLDSMATAVGNFATGQIKSWSDLGKSIVGSVKQMIAQIIAEYLKLTYLNPLINSLFSGSGVSLLQTAAGASSSGGGLGGLLQNGQSLFSGGKSLLGMFGGSGSTAAYDGVLGSALPSSYIPGAASTSFDFAGANGGSYASGGGVGTFGTVASIAGGVLAGLQEFKAAGGGIGGLTGGAAYGTAAYLGGTALAAGGGALLAGGGLAAAGGAAFGALAALGPIGWVALAAVLVDKISGGKLFGTDYQTYQTKSGIKVGADGATAFAEQDQKGQKAFFGGTKYRTKQSDPGQAAGDAAQAIFDALDKSFKAGAAQFGLTGAESVTGSWTTITEYNKKGAVTSTKTMSEVLGKQYTETAQDFASRLNSENAILLADQGGAAGEATKFAEQYRKTAATLADAAAVAFQAELDIHNGNALLGKNATFDDTVSLIQKLTVAGETLSATYSRLSAETQAVVSGASLLGATLTQSGAALVQFADDFVKAAGGAANANKLWNDFYANFFSDSERAKAAMDTARTASNTALTAIGENPTESLAKFRTDFTAALPNLTAAQVAQWLAAAEVLAAAAKAQDAYNQTVGAATSVLTQSASQLATVQGILTGNSSTLTDAHLTAAQKAIESINKAYDAQKTQLIANMATVAQLTTLEGQRNQALQDQQAIEEKAYTTFQGTLQTSLDQLTDKSDVYEKAVLAALKVQQDQITQANQLAIAAGHAGASEQDLATIHQITAATIANAMATLQASAQSLANTLYGTNVDKLNKQLAAVAQHIQDMAGMGMVDTGGFAQQRALQQQLADAQAQAAKVQRAQEATQLAQMVAEISLGQHESFADVAKSLGFTLQQLGTDLGTNDVNAYLQKQQDLAATELGIKTAAELTNTLLAQILAVARGGNLSLQPVTVGGNGSPVTPANEAPGRVSAGNRDTVVRVANVEKLMAVHDQQMTAQLSAKLDLIYAAIKADTEDRRDLVTEERGAQAAAGHRAFVEGQATLPRRGVLV